MFRKASLLSLVLRLVPLVNVPTDRFLLPPLVQLCSAGSGQTRKLDYITHCCNTVTILDLSALSTCIRVYRSTVFSGLNNGPSNFWARFELCVNVCSLTTLSGFFLRVLVPFFRCCALLPEALMAGCCVLRGVKLL